VSEDGVEIRARPPGHAPEALEDSAFAGISPTQELQALYAHLARR
jgi:hypothetical protein